MPFPFTSASFCLLRFSLFLAGWLLFLSGSVFSFRSFERPIVYFTCLRLAPQLSGNSLNPYNYGFNKIHSFFAMEQALCHLLTSVFNVVFSQWLFVSREELGLRVHRTSVCRSISNLMCQKQVLFWPLTLFLSHSPTFQRRALRLHVKAENCGIVPGFSFLPYPVNSTSISFPE